ncbi:MAG: porin family protein [Vicinamibacteria bacterium]|nr:porin family protein [Vicinamibacteria bacterium]
MKRLLPFALGLALAAPAWAQDTEISLLAGSTTSADLDRKALQVGELKVGGGFTWGLVATHFFTPRIGAELSWAHQDTALEMKAGTASEAFPLFEMELRQLHASVVYRFSNGRVQPFLTAGLGAAFLGADDMGGETRLAWALGGGVKWYPWQRAGFRAQARFNPTRLADGDSDYCDPFGFCQDSLRQFELTAGVAIRF